MGKYKIVEQNPQQPAPAQQQPAAPAKPAAAPAQKPAAPAQQGQQQDMTKTIQATINDYLGKNLAKIVQDALVNIVQQQQKAQQQAPAQQPQQQQAAPAQGQAPAAK